MPEDNATTRNEFDLTQSQTAMWTGQVLNRDTPIYNMIYTFDLAGVIDPVHFRAAFQELINGAEALRTVFTDDYGRPQQRILSRLEYEVEFLDWCSNESVDERLAVWLDDRKLVVPNLSECSFDSVLIKISDKHFVWYFNQHHLTTDALSVSLLFCRLGSLYKNLRLGEMGSVAPFPPYSSFLKFEKHSRSDPNSANVRSFWRDKSASLPVLPKLFGRNVNSSTTRSERVVVDLGKGRSEALKALTKKSDLQAFTTDLSLFNIFTTVYFGFLYRISGQHKLTVGTPVHNRTTPDFKQTPGLFIEFFPFLSEVRPDDTFESLFRQISLNTLDFLRHAIPGAGLPEANRGFNAVLNYINTDFPDFDSVPCEATWIHPNRADASHHLRLHVYNEKRSENIQLIFDLNLGVFDTAELNSVPRQFLRLLDAFIENRRQRIADPSLLSDSAKNGLIERDDSRSVQNEPETASVLELFRKRVAKNPGRTAVRDGKLELSFEELDKRSNRLARHLAEHGVTADDRVVLSVSRSADLMIGILGIWKAGGSYVPIAANNPRSRILEKIRRSRAAAVLTDRDLGNESSELNIPIINLETDSPAIGNLDATDLGLGNATGVEAYVMFTSGTTGVPKAVPISHRSLGNYIAAAARKYVGEDHFDFPLFTTIDFDLTVTSLFVPLVTGGAIVIYRETESGPDLAILDVVKENMVDVVKLTPSHLELFSGTELENSRIKKLIVGGEDLRSDLAIRISKYIPNGVAIYNEYGPTEATVGCIVHRFDPARDQKGSVPIGKPFAGSTAYLLDAALNPVPNGVTGELYVSSPGLSEGYDDDSELTEQKFVSNPFLPGTKMYRTGDLARINRSGELVYLGRIDEQLKIGGIRVEPGEIESVIVSYPGVKACCVMLSDLHTENQRLPITHCGRCGLPSNYPNAELDKNEICSLCRSFETYRRRTQAYFKTPDDLLELLGDAKATGGSKYDCLILLSGGKDSTFALAKLVEMDLSVLAYTLDNGYISDGAKTNIRKVVRDLGVDHIFGSTPSMNAIFVDSLNNHKNVCNGCFKTIYTLSTKVALENKIPFIVTGLSRGQFFETRLTEELFWNDDIDSIDNTVLEARKAYHRADDKINSLLDASVFKDESVFEKVRFVDFYRYFDVTLEEMMKYLDRQLPWVRPKDTGRSTNCLINQVGIYVHKKQIGYSNYAFPYSWDVRMGHKTRDDSIDEINEEISEEEVKRIMSEIGYESGGQIQNANLLAFYVGTLDEDDVDLRRHLTDQLPAYLIPFRFIRLDSLPLTQNGKTDRIALRKMTNDSIPNPTVFVAPETEIEKLAADIWSEILQIENIGVHDSLLELGGHSLAAIRIMTRVNDAFELDLPLNIIFETQTVANLSAYIENTIRSKLSELNI